MGGRLREKSRYSPKLNYALLIQLTMLNIYSSLQLIREVATLGPWAIELRPRQFKKVGISLMRRATLPSLLLVSVALFCATKALPQGETTSAITGQVTDATSAAIPGALVIITNRETGLQRRARADEQGRFNFPQLKPGAYSVKAEA